MFSSCIGGGLIFQHIVVMHMNVISTIDEASSVVDITLYPK